MIFWNLKQLKHPPGDCQTRECDEKAAGPARIRATRPFLTDISRWKEAARAHGEVFGAIKPGMSFIACSRLINPAWLVEIEADAVIDD